MLIKGETEMTNGLKQQKLTVNMETMPYFSASIADMHISPVTRVVLGVPEAAKNSRLEVSVVGKCGENEFIRRCDFTKDCFDPEVFNLKNSSSCVLYFDHDSFEYNKAFLNSLEEEETGEIYVFVKYAGSECTVKTDITLLPSDMWTGLECEPPVVCSFIREEDKTVEKICSDVCENGKINYDTDSRKNVISTVKELHKRIKNCSIIYTRPVGYAANIKQRLRRPEELFASGSVLATPMEIALIFCACAKKVGLDTCLVFTRGSRGEVSVLCGVYLVKTPFRVPVCEDAEKISALLNAGDLIVVDPSAFATAQDTSFLLAVESAAETFIENSHSLVCLVDVKRSLSEKGVRKEKNEYENLPVKQVLSQIYSSLMYTPAMQYLAGKERDEIEEIPLLVTDFEKLYRDDETSYKLLPLDISVKLDEYAPLDKGFSSIVTMSSPKAKQHFSENELAKLRIGYERLRERVASDSEITTALRDEELYKISTEMTFGKNKKEPYFAFGYVKITDKLTETVSFAPVCLVRAKLTYELGNFFVKQYGNPIVNKVFIRNALRNSKLGYDSFMKSLMPTDKKEIFDMFENIRMALSETDDRHIYEIIKEVHLVNVDVDDYILWSSLALERAKLIANDTVSCIFGTEKESERINREYVPVKPMFSQCMKAVCNDSNMIIDGAFTNEKEEVVSALVSRSVTEGKSMLIVTDDMEMSGYVNDLLDSAGLSEMSFSVDESCKSDKAAERISELMAKYKNSEDNGVGFVSQDLKNTEALLGEYTERINKLHTSGMSLNDAVKSYLSAGRGTENHDCIPVNREIFKGLDEDGIDRIFEISGSLITNARMLCKKSGLEKYTPINKHPLFHTRPQKDIDETAKQMVMVAIETALPVISEYRDVFSDVNEILKFDEREIDCFYKLERLNELFKLILSARDVDIPEKFVESDIADFIKIKRIAAENRKRMEEIENKLSFFNPEIFEDIENLLKGDEYEQDEDAGFIKRFVTKKNGIDKLMQYVDSDKRSEFLQHKLPEIYKLLYEYKACVIALRNSNNDKKETPETARLAQISDKADYLVSDINSSEANNKKILSNVFRLISVIPVDANLARKITVVRARLAELYSGETSAISIISKYMGICFDDIVFDSGILSFDGIGKYLEEVEKKLDVVEDWNVWLEKCETAREYVPEFITYLEEHGAGTNIDRIFAKSLLAPISDCISHDVMQGFSSEKLSRAKEKYIEYLCKASEVSAKNVFEGYKNVVRHASQLANANIGEKSAAGFCDFMRENSKIVQKVIPVLVVTKNILTEALPLETVFDTVVVIDNKNNGYSMLPALGFGQRCVIVNMSKVGGSKLYKTAKNILPSYDVSVFGKQRDVNTFTWLNSIGFAGNGICISAGEESASELVRMNGIYDRTVSRTNKTETELSMVKATSLLQDGQTRVAITAFTKQQCTAMEKLMHVLSKKNKILFDAINEGRVFVCTPDRLYLKKYDSLVVSACFGCDKDGRFGWDFGYAGKTSNEPVPEAYYAISDRKTEKTFILTSLNAKDSKFMRKTGNNAALFNDFCEMLADGRIPVNMTVAKTDNEGILCEIMSCISKRNPSVSLCEGKNSLKYAMKASGENGSYILLDNERNICMHDELLIKKLLEEKGQLVITLTPMQLTGRNFGETVESLVNEKDNI